MKSTPQKITLQAIGLFACALILFTIGLANQEIVGFEARFYVFALDAWEHGLSWFPVSYNQPYPDYPVTSTALIYLSSLLFGHLSKFTAVFPSAVAAAITVAYTFLIGALREPRWGWFAVFFLLLTNTFVREARTISPDQYIAMVTTVCFYLAYSAQLSQKHFRLIGIPVLFLIGFACRGPIGVVIPAGVIFAFYALEKNVRYLFLASLAALLVLAIGIAALWYAAYHVGGSAFVNDVWRMQVSGRMVDAQLPWYFYFSESLGAYAITFPLALFVLLGGGREFFSKKVSLDVQFLQKLLAWALIILVGLSIPAGKKIRYILAMSPALALICAYVFIAPSSKKYFYYLSRGVYSICYLLPLVCLVFMSVIYFSNAKEILNNVSMLGLMGIFLFLQAAIVIFTRYFKEYSALIAVLAAALVFIISYVGIVEKINIELNRTRDFVAAVEAVRIARNADLVFVKENPDGLPIKYIADMTTSEKPVFLNTNRELIHYPFKSIFIISVENYNQLPKAVARLFVIDQSGKIGREPIVVLKRK
ncbi:MAG: glycosyltransferase family 39 protein [Gammaproteobacteria bacterium]|nr:glycosyltransferase family 39 protein [Gammaproteobacteria bacterium]